MPMLESSRARDILSRCNAHGNFFTLSSSIIEALLAEADVLKYRKPKNANGSRGRYFHAYLVRRAESLTALAQAEVKGKNATCTMRRGRRSVTVSGY